MTDSLTMPTSPPMTGTQASLYQQLRGHLATLKLTAVAEHLPGVLAAILAGGPETTQGAR